MNLDQRMKTYEYVTRNYLVRRTPIIVRVDGKAFHTLTRGMGKPFDPVFVQTMQDTMKYLCENIQGCVLGYCQSDEITLVLVDYKSQKSSAWFDGNIQKICSISAAMATLAFNKALIENAKGNQKYDRKLFRGMFDSRAFNLPKEEVCNCLIWRQKDSERNSIQALGQANFSHRELDGKKRNQIQDMLMAQKGINWNDLPVHLRRGACCVKKQVLLNEGTENECIRNKWIVDKEIPIFTQNRDYVDQLIFLPK